MAAVEHAGTEASRLTAEVYARELEISPSASDVPLTPDAECFPPYAPQTAREQIAPTRRHIEERLELERPAILLVGHEPAIGWLLDGIDQPISLVAGEVVCLAREASTRDEWHVWWMLTPSKAAAIDQLREKIESKMTLLSVLAGFTLAVTGQVLIDLPKETGPRLLASGAAVCFVVAAATYFCTLLAYDQLMMPPRFWRGGAPAATPRGPLGPGRGSAPAELRGDRAVPADDRGLEVGHRSTRHNGRGGRTARALEGMDEWRGGIAGCGGGGRRHRGGDCRLLVEGATAPGDRGLKVVERGPESTTVKFTLRGADWAFMSRVEKLVAHW